MKCVYIVNAWESVDEWELDELAFSSVRELVKFMRSVSPKATVTKKTKEVYGCDPHVKHFLIKELHSDGVQIEFDISRIVLDYDYEGMRYIRSY